MHISVPYPDLVRTIPANFAWIDRRFRDKQFIGVLTLQELAVYLFLILAADKQGVSFYTSEKIAAFFDYHIQPFDVILSRNSLFDKGMIGFMPFKSNCSEGVYQILPLPKSIAPIVLSKRTGTISSLGDIMKTLPVSGI